MGKRSGGCQQKLQGCPQRASGRPLAHAGRDLDAGQGSTSKQPTIQSSTSPSAPTSLSSFPTSAPAHSHVGRPFTCITAQHAVVPSSPPSTSNVPHTTEQSDTGCLVAVPRGLLTPGDVTVSAATGRPWDGLGVQWDELPLPLPRCDIDVRLRTMGSSTPASPCRRPSHWLHGRIKRCG